MLKSGHHNYHCFPEPDLDFCFGFVLLDFFLSHSQIPVYLFFIPWCHGLTTLLFSYLIKNTVLIHY